MSSIPSEPSLDIKGTHPLDTHVGQKVRAYRLVRGLSQGQLGDVVGVSFQQIQKYEWGTSRITLSRLFDISKALDVPFMSFVEEFILSQNNKEDAVSDDTQISAAGLLANKDVIKLVRIYSNIPSQELKNKLKDIAKAMAA